MEQGVSILRSIGKAALEKPHRYSVHHSKCLKMKLTSLTTRKRRRRPAARRTWNSFVVGYFSTASYVFVVVLLGWLPEEEAVRLSEEDQGRRTIESLATETAPSVQVDDSITVEPPTRPTTRVTPPQQDVRPARPRLKRGVGMRQYEYDDDIEQKETPPPSPAPKQPQTVLDEQEEFMTWCEQVLGIETILEIQTFTYTDYMTKLPEFDWEDDLKEPVKGKDEKVEELPTIQVRGLAAARDIEEGETVIRIPLKALFSVGTTIDQDPVLSKVMGPEARRKHGWELKEEDQENAASMEDLSLRQHLFEMPLLATALLHHAKLGSASPMSPYLRILDSSPVDSMPFLWPAERVRELPEGIRAVARGIRQEIRDMYQSIVQVLIEQHPALFGRPAGDKEWMFSYEKFQWAFAIVNSRHWQLPIQDLMNHRHPMHTTEGEQMGVPPAETPTETWTRDQGDTDDIDDKTDGSFYIRGEAATADKDLDALSHHSFLAPVADLLNFGPPCTRGHYNQESHTFDIIASCSFTKGQEVTFWYSDECDHVMAGVYGFIHPLIPQCPSGEELRVRAEVAEERLTETYDELDQLDAELNRVEQILKDCDCCRYEKRSGARLRDGAAADGSVRGKRKQGVRRPLLSRKEL